MRQLTPRLPGRSTSGWTSILSPDPCSCLSTPAGVRAAHRRPRGRVSTTWLGRVSSCLEPVRPITARVALPNPRCDASRLCHLAGEVSSVVLVVAPSFSVRTAA